MNMRRSAGALILIIALILPVPAIAEPLKDAKKAYDRRDYQTAIRFYKPLANGDPEAQYWKPKKEQQNPEERRTAR